ncbi:biotin transporter BioY [Dehalobacter sp. DCM]|uniref:biotin transporter BioY n=1 Tax=Dehalobacter sp. DCM TaxID=2907827 RepID=UPI003081A829|nr:biotin transporter BioY [Dehalobacter sp. DCM]
MYQNLKALDIYRQKRLSYYQWRSQSSVIAKITLALSLACLTGLLAQVKVVLPFTPVPLVASQFGVILAAILLGGRWGGISMAIYAVGGFAGIPWFAGFKGGAATLLGANAGYVLGFILAAWFIGSMIDSQIENRKALPLTAVILFAQLVLVYIPGLVTLALWLAANGQPVTLTGVLWMGYIPFILGDVLKSLVGAAAAKAIVPMEKY